MFDLKFKWLPDTVVKEVNERVEMLDRQDENSMFAYQKIVLNLAAGDMNPERLLMIYFFSESVKEHIVQKYSESRRASTGIRDGYVG